MYIYQDLISNCIKNNKQQSKHLLLCYVTWNTLPIPSATTPSHFILKPNKHSTNKPSSSKFCVTVNDWDWDVYVAWYMRVCVFTCVCVHTYIHVCVCKTPLLILIIMTASATLLLLVLQLVLLL